jgi:hypothetical protein
MASEEFLKLGYYNAHPYKNRALDVNKQNKIFPAKFEAIRSHSNHDETQ